MEQLLRDWDGECVVIRYFPEDDAWIFIALHSSVLGTPVGGTRLRVYDRPRDGLRDALRLAEGMTRKWAVLGRPTGGGKAVIACSGPLAPARRRALLLALGDLIERMPGAFETGEDLGISMEDIDIVGERTDRVVGRSPALGGVGDPGPFTARGVLEGIKACSRFLFGTDDLAGRSVAVQGVGSVGHSLLELLAAEGAGPLYFTDIDPAAVERTVASGRAEHVEPDSIYACEVDVFSPCAVGAVLDAKTIPRLRCRAVAGGANNQLATPEDGGRLADRGILYAPDYVVNGGGALALPALERMGWTDDQVVEGLVGIGRTLDQLFRVAADEGIPTAEAAERMAQACLARAGT